jgi:multidrug efflux system membrane fusion protein
MMEPPPRAFATRRLRNLLLLAVLVAAFAFAMWAANRAEPAIQSGGADKIAPVTVATATVQDLSIWKSGVGSVEPLEAVDVKARVDGQVTRIAYADGQEVHAGALLAQLDPRPYQALLAQAAANKAKDAAQLANIRLNLARSKKLNARGFATGQAVEALEAQLAALTATLAADQAQIDTARLNLDFTSIRAPIAGRAGIRKLNTGTMVHSNDAAGIVTVTQMAPIAIIFSLPQDDLAEIRGAASRATVFAYTRDGGNPLAQGTLSAIGSQIDAANGQIELKALFPNGNRALWPGELVSVRILVGVKKGAVVVPATAVQAGQAGSFVFVLQPGNKVVARPVAPGVTVDGLTAIASGLAAGEIVVTSGQSRIATGSKVSPKRLAAAAP